MVITLATFGKIRRMSFRDDLSLSEISRRTSLSRNTIRAWLRKPQGTEPKDRRERRPGKLAAFEAVLVRALEADARRPKRDWRSVRALFAEIKAQGYTGGYTLVTDFVRHWRSRGGKALARAKVRVVNARFAAMASHDLFDTDFCNVASGGEKGVVEKNVQDSRRRLWQEAGQRRFGSFAELTAWLLERCRAVWSQVRHPEDSDLTVAEMLAHEQDAHAGAVRRLCGDPGTGVEHRPGDGCAQPQLRALRGGRADGEHSALLRARRPLEPGRRARVP
jgi:transposase